MLRYELVTDTLYNNNRETFMHISVLASIHTYEIWSNSSFGSLVIIYAYKFQTKINC